MRVFVDGRDLRPIHLRRRETALVALFRRTLGPGAAQVVVVTAAERAGELGIQKERHIGFDGSWSDLIMGNQAADRRFDECTLGRGKELEVRAGDPGWFGGQSFSP